MQTRTLTGLILVATAGTVAGCGSSTNPSTTTTYKATLLGTNETPPNTSPGTGLATLTVDANKLMTYTITVNALSGSAVASHIHGPAGAGVAASVLKGFTITPGIVSGTLATGTIDLTQAVTATVSGDSLLKLMNTGQAYVNVHGPTPFGGGEIRGQIVKQ